MKTGRKTAYEEYQFKPLVNKCYNWLLKNFHKFDDGKKIQIAIEVVKRAMPTQVKGDMNVVLSAKGLVESVTQVKQAVINRVADEELHEDRVDTK